MPQYEYQCGKCGYIDMEIMSVDNRHVPCAEECPLCLKSVGRSKIVSLPAQHLQIKHENRDWPYKSHIVEEKEFRDTTGKIARDANGKPLLKNERVVFESRRQQEEYMAANGYVYYEDHAEEGENEGRASTPVEMPDDLKVWEDHPIWLKYKADKAARRIPESMNLTEEELKERFHV
tara:strand:- start:1562 stop:2092 length:531 start_codon:yes stop_codon:yes gene_type:complete